MQRLFGKFKETPPPPSLDDTIKSIASRVEGLDSKINALNVTMLKYNEQMKKTRLPSTIQGIKSRAMNALKQRKVYEAQRDQLLAQSFSLEQTSFATQSLQQTFVQVNAMKDVKKTLKNEMKKVNKYEIEELNDDLQELLEENDAIQQVLSQPYDMNISDTNEEGLEEELLMLESELLNHEEGLEENGTYWDQMVNPPPSHDPSFAQIQQEMNPISEKMAQKKPEEQQTHL